MEIILAVAALAVGVIWNVVIVDRRLKDLTVVVMYQSLYLSSKYEDYGKVTISELSKNKE